MSKNKRQPIQKNHEKLPDWSSEIDWLKRQLEIEAALERVRARAMAMHKGDELADTSLLLFEQITKLGNKSQNWA